jgi:DNA-binding transcriptional LysR family regulator
MSPELLPYLATFTEAAERSSFTAAARHLGLSQAAVSQRIHQLEALVKTPLFRRAGGRVELTDAGRKLHDYARRILDLTAEAWCEVTGEPGEVEGELALAASSVPGHHLLPHALAGFRERHPRVRVKVAVSDTAAALRLVEQGRAHLALVGDRGGSPDLEFRPFATDELVLVVPKRHPWWRRRQVSPAELRTVPLIQREHGSGSRQCFEREAGAAGPLNVVLELGSTEAIKGAVLEGVGVAVLSRRAVRDEVRAGKLKPIGIEGVALSRDICVAWDRKRVLPPHACLFLAHLASDAADPHKPRL